MGRGILEYKSCELCILVFLLIHCGWLMIKRNVLLHEGVLNRPSAGAFLMIVRLIPEISHEGELMVSLLR